MKKIQLPAIGGIRKVIRPDGGASADLTALVSQLNQLTSLVNQFIAAQNTGGGNIGKGDEGTLVPGPGLSGGGPLIGNVPIRLTAPIPWDGDSGGGADGDPGPPGAAGVAGAPGATGAQGPLGPAVFLEAEQGDQGDPGPPGGAGPAGAQGAQGIQGAPGAQGPIGPLMFLDDGAPGDDGIPGPMGVAGAAGAVGATGPQGPAGTGTGGGSGTLMMWVPEENWPDDVATNPLPPVLGPLVVNGQLNVNGLAVHSSSMQFTAAITTLDARVAGGSTLYVNAATAIALSLNGHQVLTANNNQQVLVTGANGIPTLIITGGTGNSASDGVIINAGTTNADYSLQVNNTGGNQVLQIYGDGGLTLGKGSGANFPASQGVGTINVEVGYFVSNVPLARIFGAGLMMLADDNYGDDQGFMPPLPTNLGPLTVVNGLTVNGSQNNSAIITYSADSHYGLEVHGSATLGKSVGIQIIAGTNNVDYGLNIANQANTLTLFRLVGDLSWRLGGDGNGTGGGNVACMTGPATGGVVINKPASGQGLNVKDSIGITGATPAVTAAQTDLGNTTTTTVITTAGGVAIPALASVMWRVNVNGVAYGVPCFAL